MKRNIFNKYLKDVTETNFTEESILWVHWTTLPMISIINQYCKD